MNSILIPERFFDKQTGVIFQPKRLNTGDRYVDSMFLTTNTAYQLNDKNLFEKTFYCFYNGTDFMRYLQNEENGRLNSSPKNLSRDNFIGMLICLGHFEKKDILKQEALKILKRGSFYQNTRTYLYNKPKIPDFAGPVSWAVILKGLGYKNIILDLFVLMMSIYAVLKSRIVPDHASTVYHEVSTFDYLKQNSFLTKLANLLYNKYRKGVEGYPSSNGVVSALKYYSRAVYDPPIYEVTEMLQESKWQE